MRIGAPLAPALLAALLACLAPCRPTGAAEEPGTIWEVWYSIEARVRSARADADLEGGGSLSMNGRRLPSGALSLSLGEVRIHPWKLYWLDPIGPLGEEVKMSSVVTLPEAGWEALEAARLEAEAEGAVRHRRWLDRAERPRGLDGTFAFVVIGPERDRFRLEIAGDGRLVEVVNRMTDRWLPGPFDQFLETPHPSGYWFWNLGETEPFEYEPHTYHAFAAALELLALPLPGAGAENAVWTDLAPRALRVLETLAPRTPTSRLSDGFAPATELVVSRSTGPDGAARLEMASSGTPAEAHAERETVFSSDGEPVSDRIRVRLNAPRGGSLEIAAGYRVGDHVENRDE